MIPITTGNSKTFECKRKCIVSRSTKKHTGSMRRSRKRMAKLWRAWRSMKLWSAEPRFGERCKFSRPVFQNKDRGCQNRGCRFHPFPDGETHIASRERTGGSSANVVFAALLLFVPVCVEADPLGADPKASEEAIQNAHATPVARAPKLDG